MKRLLLIEWSKISHYRPFWIFTIISLLLAPVSAFLYPEMDIQFLTLPPDELYRFPMGWHSVAYVSSWFIPFMGIVMVIFTCNEFSSKTTRQHIIDGMTRNEYFMGKVLFIVVYALVSTIFVFLTGILCSLVYTGGLSDMFKGLEYLGLYFYQAVAYMSFALMFAFLLRKSGYAILIFISVIFAEFVVRQFIDKDGAIAQYFPLRVVGNLVTMPDVSAFVKMVMKEGKVHIHIMSQDVKFYFTTLYMAIFLGISYVSFKKRMI